MTSRQCSHKAFSNTTILFTAGITHLSYISRKLCAPPPKPNPEHPKPSGFIDLGPRVDRVWFDQDVFRADTLTCYRWKSRGAINCPISNDRKTNYGRNKDPKTEGGEFSNHSFYHFTPTEDFFFCEDY